MIDYNKMLKSIIIKELNNRFRHIPKKIKLIDYLKEKEEVLNVGQYCLNLSNENSDSFYFYVNLDKNFSYMIEYVDKENKISYSLTFNDKDKKLIHKKYADTIKLFIEKIYIPKLVENAIVGINYQKKREFLK